MKKTIKIEYEIPMECWAFLVLISDGRQVEYRDPEYATIEDFRNCKITYPSPEKIKNFLDRNYNGTYYLISELLKYNFVQEVPNTWHSTYQISELGLQVVKTNQ